jgi:hypothetical protein
MNFITTQPRIINTNDWMMSVAVRFMGSLKPVQVRAALPVFRQETDLL